MFTEEEITPNAATTAEKKKWQIPLVGMTPLELLVLLALVVFIRGYVFQLFQVSGPSMCPTLNVVAGECHYPTQNLQTGLGQITSRLGAIFKPKSEMVWVNQVAYRFLRDPERGEVVVFKSPVENIYVIKRVVGVPGDTIEIKNGELYLTNEQVTNKRLDETYLNEKNKGNTRTFGVTSFTVPEGKYMLMGDNRAQSQDARHCYRREYCGQDVGEKPFIEKADIRGRASSVIWPVASWRSLPAFDYGVPETIQ